MDSRKLLVAACLVLFGTAGYALTSKTIEVDCAKGQSINAALATKAEELVIEIAGRCQEDVEIRRDRVILRGADPLQDGIVAVEGVFGAALSVRDSRGISIESLEITNASTGLAIYASGAVTVQNCLVHGNANDGVAILDSSTVEIYDTVISDNGLVGGNAGLRVRGGSEALCVRCTVRDNRWAVLADSGGNARLESSDLSGYRGVYVGAASAAVGVDSRLSSPTWALVSIEAGDVSWINGEVAGSLTTGYGGVMDLYGVTQTASPLGNFISGGGLLFAQGWNGMPLTLTGPTTVEDFARAVFTGYANAEVVLGDLICISGGDAVCHGTVGKTSSTCGFCP